MIKSNSFLGTTVSQFMARALPSAMPALVVSGRKSNGIFTISSVVASIWLFGNPQGSLRDRNGKIVDLNPVKLADLHTDGIVIGIAHKICPAASSEITRFSSLRRKR